MTLDAQDDKGLSVYWDYQTTCLNLKAVSGYEVVRTIRSALLRFGPVQSFKAYHDSTTTPLSNLSSELGSSGVTVIDCPTNGRKEAPTKMMIVDVIAHTCDHPAPRTIVIISGDRDLAYLIATLRMRRYQVVLISPSGTHASILNQASVNLEWSSVNGRKTDLNNSYGGPPSPHPPSLPHPPPSPRPPLSPPSPHLPPSPSFPPSLLPPTSGHFSRYPKSNFSLKAHETDPPMVELRGIPTSRGRRGSAFPNLYEPDRFNIFGDLGESLASPKMSNGIFGLGHGPLFSRSQSRVSARQVRSDSAPPGFVYSTHSPSRPSSPPKSNDVGGISSMKGKQREFPLMEPEDIAPQSPLSGNIPEAPRSTSVVGMEEHPSSTKVNVPSSRGMARSSVTSQDSVFSVIQFIPSSAPTPVETANTDNKDTTGRGKISGANVVIAPQEPTPASPKNPAFRDTEKVSASPGKVETPRVDPAIQAQVSKPIPSMKPPPQAPSTLPPSVRKAPPPKETTSIEVQAGPSSSTSPKYAPSEFHLLVDILRGYKVPYPKSILPAVLLKHDPGVYRKAGVNQYTKYIAAAVQAAVVKEVITTNGPCISLTTAYA